MNNTTQIIRGMHDLIPDDVIKWNYIENILKKTLINYCYDEIRLPIVEKEILFKKSIGTITDVFEKEMYSFRDKSNNKICLRPEGTAGCVRAAIANSLIFKKKQRLWYIGPMFRYERPQKGRYRQFFQLGVEIFGYSEPEIDIEIILLNIDWWKKLNLDKYLTLEINTIGSIEDRKVYQKELTQFLIKNKSYLDKQSKDRLLQNPFRILDSKNKEVQKLLLDAPKLFNFLNKKSIFRFNFFCKLLDSLNIKYIVNNNLVRGLDYYNDTVFEWKYYSSNMSQNTICAGGRYDNLVEKIGNYSSPAIGCAVGMERLISLNLIISKKLNLFIKKIDLFVSFLYPNLYLETIKLSKKIRKIFKNVKMLLETSYTTEKKHLKKANELNAKIFIFITSKDIKTKTIFIKDLEKKINFKFSENELFLFLKEKLHK
ncbi:histidine--tRNA ligase [Buchnera aphidicola]|uniref:histidine--tRNA ligase n=1 Tax=Buchnera aphidicola TaxID=9 RepID=UPI0031B71665